MGQQMQNSQQSKAFPGAQDAAAGKAYAVAQLRHRAPTAATCKPCVVGTALLFSGTVRVWQTPPPITWAQVLSDHAVDDLPMVQPSKGQLTRHQLPHCRHHTGKHQRKPLALSVTRP